MPVIGHASKCVCAALFESQTRASHQVAYGLRNQYFAWARKGCNARADMHCDSGEVAANDFAFSGVQAASHFKAKRANRIADRAGTSDRSRRPVEGRQEAVTRGSYL